MDALKGLATAQDTLDHVLTLIVDAEYEILKAHAQYEKHHEDGEGEQAVDAASRVLIFDARRKAMTDLYKFITDDDFPPPED